MRKGIIGILLTAFLLTTTPALAGSLEPGYVPDERVSTPWYGKQNTARRNADLNFIAGMRPHHEGALSMAESYLNDSGAANAQLKQLARAIFHNQLFEIGMLNDVERFVSRPIPAGNESTKRRIATKGLGQVEKFYRMPIPGPWDEQEGRGGSVSVRDVQFAKAMIVHHQAALRMADGYLRNPVAKNGYLEKMSIDILLDQEQEIRFMKKILALYPGDARGVVIDSSMIHGMNHEHHPAAPVEQVQPTQLSEDDMDAPEGELVPSETPAEGDNGWLHILRKLKKEPEPQ